MIHEKITTGAATDFPNSVVPSGWSSKKIAQETSDLDHKGADELCGGPLRFRTHHLYLL